MNLRSILDTFAELTSQPKKTLQTLRSHIGLYLLAPKTTSDAHAETDHTTKTSDSTQGATHRLGRWSQLLLQRTGAKPEEAAKLLEAIEDSVMKILMRDDSDESELYLRQIFAELVDLSISEKNTNPPLEHPSFRSIIKELVPDEALILCLLSRHGDQPLLDVKAYSRLSLGEILVAENFSAIGQTVGARFPKRVPAYIDNLCRLGLTRIYGANPHDRDLYEMLERDTDLQALRQKTAKELQMKIRLERKRIALTSLGTWFCQVCGA